VSTIAQQQPPPGGDRPIPMEIRPQSGTPVYGSAQPTTGPAEQLRRLAYRQPAHDPKRWLLLLAADRTETTGHLLREALSPCKQTLLARHLARQARAYPRGFAGALAALGGLALWVLNRARRRRRGVLSGR
jgi:hypothetical protein